jgi:hypothetical protein
MIKCCCENFVHVSVNQLGSEKIFLWSFFVMKKSETKSQS